MYTEMDPTIEQRSRKCLMEDITFLKTQLSDLQGRFDLIVDWIKSQYDDDLIGLPDPIANAVRTNPVFPEIVKIENITIKREKLSPEEMEAENAEGSSLYDQMEENSSCDQTDNLETLYANNETDEEPNKFETLATELDKTILKDAEPLEDSCNIINLNSLQTNRRTRVKKTPKHIQQSLAEKLILNAFEYEEMIASLSWERLACVVCSKIFQTSKQLRRHELEVHLTKEEQKIFRNREKTVNPKKATAIIKKSPNVENLPNVEKVKEAKTVKKCEICGLMISARCLNQHMFIHKGERNFLCNQCGQSFRRRHTLKMHELAIHEKVRNHKCRYCEKTFVFQYVKDSHEKKHFGASKVKCDLCGFSFTCPRNLKRHIIGVHENQRLYKCHLCDKSFKTSIARKYHINTHGNPNGRKRGLNADVDPMKAAAKRRHCPDPKNYRVPLLTAEVRTTLSPVKTEAEES